MMTAAVLSSYRGEGTNWRASRLRGDRLATYILGALIIATVFQQHPAIIGGPYQQYRQLLYIGFGVYGFLTFVFSAPRDDHPLIKQLAMILLYALTWWALTEILGGRLDASVILEALVPLGILFCATRIHMLRRDLRNLAIAYVLAVIFVGVATVPLGNAGTGEAAVHYIYAKNQVGPILGIATITCFWLVVRPYALWVRPSPRLIRLIGLITAGLLFTMLVALENRAGIIGVLIVTLIVLLSEYWQSPTSVRIRLTASVLVISIAVGLSGVAGAAGRSIWDSLTANRDVGNVDDLSSGRVSLIEDALAFIPDHFLLGNLFSDPAYLGVPHNYVLNKFVQFGVLGSVPFIALYVGLWRRALKGRGDAGPGEEIRDLSGKLLLFLLFVSLWEYSYPFGPGVSSAFVWMLMGARETT